MTSIYAARVAVVKRTFIVTVEDSEKRLSLSALAYELVERAEDRGGRDQRWMRARLPRMS